MLIPAVSQRKRPERLILMPWFDWRDAGGDERLGDAKAQPSCTYYIPWPVTYRLVTAHIVLYSWTKNTQQQANGQICWWLLWGSLLFCLLFHHPNFIGIAVWPLPPTCLLASLLRVCQGTCCNLRTHLHQVRKERLMELCMPLFICLLNCLLSQHLLNCLPVQLLLLCFACSCPIHSTTIAAHNCHLCLTFNKPCVR